ncbi:MAG: T9SS type A sorting domain-containing protein [Bacteroidia bacterium]|nr:T9SS type A sorting domain-containing protein [Bacteroidia bacterium]
MKQLLQTKLSTLIILAMLFSASANAQIIYTDVNPDSTITCLGSACTKSYNVDLNNDGVSDYSISSVRNGNICQHGGLVYRSSVSVSALNTNAVVAVTSTTYPLAMSFNNVISSGLSLSASGFVFNKYWGNCGTGTLNLWPNSVDRYLGLKLIVGTNTYYGWARMQVVFGSQPTFTIKDYAYNTIPNQPIRAGETSCATPTVYLTQSGSLTFCNGDSVTLTANGTGYQYQWKRNNVNIAGATAKTYTAKTDGIYKCKVTNSCGSKGSGSRTVTVPCRTTDDNVVEIGEQLSVYPNPAFDQLNLEFPFTEGDAIITVVNSLGQTLLKQSVTSADEDIQVNVQDLSEGLYFITVQNGERAFYSRFIKK